jgi:D-proline reductase (dithiol) PrdB
VIEGYGIPTLVIGTALDIIEKVKPPRAVFVDHPVGRTFGPPHSRQQNSAVLRKALAEFPLFSRSGEIRDLGCQWEEDGSRAWEEELRAEILRDR